MAEKLSWQEMLASARNNFEDGVSETVQPEKHDDAPVKHSERLDIVLEKKGRGGKMATIICGFSSFTDEEILELASKMKSKLATGGSARGNEILVQGDRRKDVLEFLTAKGLKARII